MRILVPACFLVGFALTASWELNAAESSLRSPSELVDLQIGAIAPTIYGIDDRGDCWASSDYIGKQYLVVFFYPADFTTGCVKQAETFRDKMNQLNEQGIKVVGISGDSISTHELFKKSWNLNYTLLADDAGHTAVKFGVPVKSGGTAMPVGPDRKRLLNEKGEPFRIERNVTFARWTFIIGKDGKILYKNTHVQPANDSLQVSEFIEKLAAKEFNPREK